MLPSGIVICRKVEGYIGQYWFGKFISTRPRKDLMKDLRIRNDYNGLYGNI